MNRKFTLRAIEHALAAGALIAIPSLWLGDAIWRAEYSIVLVVVVFATLYFLGALGLVVGATDGTRTDLRKTLIVGIAAFGTAFIFLAFAEWKWPAKFGAELPVIVPLTSFLVGIVLLVGLIHVRDSFAGKVLVLGVLLLGGLAAQLSLPWQKQVTPTRVATYVDTSLYVLKTTTYRDWISDGNTNGGGIASFGDGYLLTGGDGGMFFVSERADNSALEVRKLAYRVPFNPDVFDREANAILKHASRRADGFLTLRVADIQVQQRPDDSFRLFVSHHYWKTREACAVVRISVLEGRSRDLLDPAGGLKWRTVYETSPCIKLNIDGLRGLRFAALQIGGAMAFPSEDEILLAVGDHEFDGWSRVPALPQDPASPYGKVMLIHLNGGPAELYSSGHRNPQGLYLDSGGTIWSTEHGPRGGDELNRITRGANYGWPFVTYGTEYTLHSWPLTAASGRHEGFEKPVIAFVPSIAVSALIGVTGARFRSWEGDLLLVSLSGELRRIRIEDRHAVLAEPFTIGDRIRDIAQGSDGRIVLWTDTNEVIFVEPAGTDDAESLVFQCTGCHTFSRDEHSSIAPKLHGLIGRPVGAATDFNYSPAMLRFGGRWTRERLDRFLENPSGTVPGTTMQFAGIQSAAERKRLIDYLERSWRKDAAKR